MHQTTGFPKPAWFSSPTARWTLEPLAGELVGLTAHDSVSREIVRRRLAEDPSSLRVEDMWCIPQPEYVARMEDVLDLYVEAPDPKRPVVRFDESPTQLIGEMREPIPIFLDVHRPWHKLKVTDSLAAVDFAARMRELTDVYPQAVVGIPRLY